MDVDSIRHQKARDISCVKGKLRPRITSLQYGCGMEIARHKMRALFYSVRYPSALVLVQRAIYDVRPHAAAEQQDRNAQSE
jgi:hypothetical protein